MLAVIVLWAVLNVRFILYIHKYIWKNWIYFSIGQNFCEQNCRLKYIRKWCYIIVLYDVINFIRTFQLLHWIRNLKWKIIPSNIDLHNRKSNNRSKLTVKSTKLENRTMLQETHSCTMEKAGKSIQHIVWIQ